MQPPWGRWSPVQHRGPLFILPYMQPLEHWSRSSEADVHKNMQKEKKMWQTDQWMETQWCIPSRKNPTYWEQATHCIILHRWNRQMEGTDKRISYRDAFLKDASKKILSWLQQLIKLFKSIFSCVLRGSTPHYVSLLVGRTVGQSVSQLVLTDLKYCPCPPTC